MSYVTMVFHILRLNRKTKHLVGDLPTNNCCSVGCIINDFLYIFGGEVNNATSAKVP